MINLKLNSLRTHIDLEEDWFPYQTGQTFCQTDQWYFPVNWWRTRSQIWNWEPPSMPTLSACNIIRIYSKVEDYEIENKTHASTPDMNERKWRQSRLQLHLVTKSRGRRELGLPTSSAAVLPLKIMPCTMFRSIQTFSVNGKFTESYHIFCARIDLFTIFVCSRYRPWATIMLLHNFGFVMCVNSRLYCTHFSCHWRKIRNDLRRLTQISKRQRDPWALVCTCN